MSGKERIKLEVSQAMAIIADGDTVHTFRNVGHVLIGADWDRAEIEKAIEIYGCEFAGEQARAMKHGLTVADKGPNLFIATKAYVDWESEEAEAKFRQEQGDER